MKMAQRKNSGMLACVFLLHAVFDLDRQVSTLPLLQMAIQIEA